MRTLRAHGHRAPWPCTPTPTPTRRMCATPTKRCASARRRADESYLDDRPHPRCGAQRRRRCGPSRLRLPGRERRLRRAVRRRRPRASSGRRSTRSGRWAARSRRSAIMTAAGVPVVPGVSGAGLDDAALIAAATRDRAPAADQGVGRRRRQGHAPRARRGGARRGAGGGAARGAARVRRRHAAARALLRRAAPHRDPDLRRHARHGRASLRARVLDPAPLSEGDRGGAVAGASTRRCARAWARPRSTRRPRDRLRRRRHGRVHRSTATGEFYFLEVNTRLQVEHPVTEAITGLDLVALQIRDRAGRAAAVRPGRPAASSGHAIEARLYAEDPARRLPAVDRHASPSGQPQRRLPGVRYDSGVESGTEVGVHYDPMLAKVIAHGADARRRPCERLTGALAQLARGGRDHQPRAAARGAASSGLRGRRARHALHRPPSAGRRRAPSRAIRASIACTRSSRRCDGHERRRRRAAVRCRRASRRAGATIAGVRRT